MILDAELILAEKQTLTSTFTSKALDLGQKNPDLGMYPQLFLAVIPTAADAGAGSITVNLQDCDTESGSYTTIASAVVKAADLTTDFAFRFPVTHRQFVKVNVVPSSITTLAATIAITDNFDKPAWLFRDTVEFETPNPDAMKVNLESQVQGVLPVVNGGTGKNDGSNLGGGA